MCYWTLVDEDMGLWHTDCQNDFQFYGGDPEESGFKFCPYCGDSLEVTNVFKDMEES